MAPPPDKDVSPGSILRELIVNQYQAIVLGGTALVSLIALNPLPLMFLLGSELVLLPILDSGPLRRLVARRKLEIARAEAAQERQRLIGDLAPASAKRYEAMEELCRLIETNYQGLNGISQVYLSEQRGKLDTILQGYLNRLMAIQRYERLPPRRTEAEVEEEIDVLEREMREPDVPERAAAALQKNLELKRKLLASLKEVDGTVRALVTELDSIESLLDVLHQSSISLRDPHAISADLDAIVRQSEDSERIVREMESLLASDSVGWRSDAIREPAPPSPGKAPTIGASKPKVKGR